MFAICQLCAMLTALSEHAERLLNFEASTTWQSLVASVSYAAFTTQLATDSRGTSTTQKKLEPPAFKKTPGVQAFSALTTINQPPSTHYPPLPRNLHIRVPLVQRRAFGAAFILVDEVHVAEAHQVEDRRVEVVDVHLLRDRVQADFIRLADRLAP